MSQTVRLQPPPLRNQFNAPGVPGIDRDWTNWLLASFNAVNGIGFYSEGSHASRLATAASGLPSGSVWYETDRTVAYLVVSGTWAYLSGTMQTAQAGLPADLVAGDVGFLAAVTDFGHLLQWTGAAWNWGPGDNGSGMVQGFVSAPTGAGWHLCDGSVVGQLLANGTVSNVTLPNYAVPAYLKLSTIASVGPNVASGQSDLTSAGTPSGTVSQPTLSGSTSVESATTVVQAGAGATVAAQNHTHTPGTLAVSQPTFTGNPMATHQHGPGTLDLRNTQLQAFFRQ